MADIPEKVLQAVKEASQERRLSCARAHELAEELKVSLLIIGQAADRLDIKITKCQLGCF